MQQQHSQKEQYFDISVVPHQPLSQTGPIYNDPLQFFMCNQFVEPRIEPMQQVQPPQNFNNNASAMRLSLNSSTGNIFDTISAANSLINNF